MIPQLQVIELTAIDIEQFKLFRQYQDQFSILLKEGVFDPYVGFKAVHKDGTAEIRQIGNNTISRY